MLARLSAKFDLYESMLARHSAKFDLGIYVSKTEC